MSHHKEDFDDKEYEGWDGPARPDNALEETLQNCGQTHDGTCTKAGSEECDWECPFSR